MTNKYNIDDFVFHTENSITDRKLLRVTMSQVQAIEKISGDGHEQIIYTVKCIYAVNHVKQRWEGPKSMDERSLASSFQEIECRHNKAIGKFYERS